MIQQHSDKYTMLRIIVIKELQTLLQSVPLAIVLLDNYCCSDVCCTHQPSVPSEYSLHRQHVIQQYSAADKYTMLRIIVIKELQTLLQSVPLAIVLLDCVVLISHLCLVNIHCIDSM